MRICIAIYDLSVYIKQNNRWWHAVVNSIQLSNVDTQSKKL